MVVDEDSPYKLLRQLINSLPENTSATALKYLLLIGTEKDVDIGKDRNHLQAEISISLLHGLERKILEETNKASVADSIKEEENGPLRIKIA